MMGGMSQCCDQLIKGAYSLKNSGGASVYFEYMLWKFSALVDIGFSGFALDLMGTVAFRPNPMDVLCLFTLVDFR